MLLEKHGLAVDSKTVRNSLRSAGLIAVHQPKKPRLSPKNIRDRLDFARSHADWTLDDRKRVIWSEETKINCYCSDRRAYAWICEGTSLRSHQVQQTVKHGGSSVMVWGCMTYEGAGFMCKIDGRMDGPLYRSILQDELKQTIDFFKLSPSEVIFQHDNDPKHRSRLVQDWLGEQEYAVVEWPSCSPDLNPIEHLWPHLKRQLGKYEKPPSGMLELWERVQEEWGKIPAEVCANLIDSLPRRIKAVIRAKGRWTRY
ncbi:hypothetical protein CLOM_g1247 [Closterium sp. NIES-68]|nr:hypothetical protein CLOM_g1247 [Closterium sp. NIES-68]